jgi:hypothetical protein
MLYIFGHTRVCLATVEHSQFCSFVVIFYFRITQYNVDAQNTHAHSPLWTHVRKPCPMSTSEGLSQHITRFMKSPQGDITYHWKYSAVKSWNKSRKMQAPVPSRGLEPGWASSTMESNQLIYDQFAPLWSFTHFHVLLCVPSIWQVLGTNPAMGPIHPWYLTEHTVFMHPHHVA